MPVTTATNVALKFNGNSKFITTDFWFGKENSIPEAKMKDAPSQVMLATLCCYLAKLSIVEVEQSAVDEWAALTFRLAWLNSDNTATHLQGDRAQPQQKHQHTTEYRGELHLLSAPVGLWGRWGGGRSCFRQLLLEYREFQTEGKTGKTEAREEVEEKKKWRQTAWTGRTEQEDRALQRGGQRSRERAELIRGNEGGFSLRCSRVLCASLDASSQGYIQTHSCTERMVSKYGPYTHKHSPTLKECTVTSINLLLTCESD